MIVISIFILTILALAVLAPLFDADSRETRRAGEGDLVGWAEGAAKAGAPGTPRDSAWVTSDVKEERA